jgi:hypothetical protein
MVQSVSWQVMSRTIRKVVLKAPGRGNGRVPILYSTATYVQLVGSRNEWIALTRGRRRRMLRQASHIPGSRVGVHA